LTPAVFSPTPQAMRDLRPVLERFAPLAGQSPASLTVTPMTGGLINDTFALGDQWVLQRLHRIFAAEVNLDIAALVPHLLAAGVPVPELQASLAGPPWVQWEGADERAGVWRILSRLDGDTLHKLGSLKQANAAAALLARFHGALAGVEHTFAFTRPGAHDTDRHMQVLGQALETHAQHRLHAAVRPLAEELVARWRDCPRIAELPTRIIHGDAKVSNFLFRGEAAVAVLDLDTMAHSTLDIELGDALRSWCNPTTEDDPAPRFDVAVFGAVVSGYAGAADGWLTDAERKAMPAGALRICLELSARFAADALNEAYFGWDGQRYPARGEHNLARAIGQLGLARDLSRQWPELSARVA
jgi:Ser/Thr protein kinase RdoA (MazF antagonist)